ncbi:unnamed protein product [Allacma fusca]|uniref:HIT-type domain-containing protein n=1 Tax=Allacma fusca TaxID=39272 RepID=A0A8J2P838_9HEXA|nr:unnamed protein product [Allacma fusca]
MDSEEKLCRICHKDNAKYVCPQCGIEFCSSSCYRNPEKHLKCSEDFYRRCVQENVIGRTDDDKVKRMKDILRRFHNENPPGIEQENFEINSDEEEDDGLDSDDDDPLEKRLGTLDLDNSEEVWNVLTPEEKAEFERMVRKTAAKGVEVVAEPWCPGKSNVFIEEVGSSSTVKLEEEEDDD